MALTIKTHGKYYFRQGEVKGEKDFAVDFRSPSMDVFQETHQKYIGTDDDGKMQFRRNTFFNIRGLLKKRYLPKILSQKLGDFVRIKFVVIDEILDEKGKEVRDLPVDLQSRKQLAVTIKDGRMPIDADDYIEIDELRSDIREYVENPSHFLDVIKPRKDKRRGVEREIMELNGLNGLVPGEKVGKVEKPAATGILD